jgi:hypothetical protein
MKKIYITLSLILAITTSISCDKGDGIFTRENDALSFDCTEQSIEQNILCDGNWESDLNGNDWISISPESGHGNGNDYSTYSVQVQYNSGISREGTIFIVHGGKKYPINISQGKCDFSYGTPVFIGSLYKGITSTASISVPYSCASGKETVSVSANFSGESNGLSLGISTYSSFSKGDGTVEIPIDGSSTKTGDVTIEILMNGVSVGTVSKKILSDPNASPEGLPVGWNFYSTGITPLGSDYDFSWSPSAKNVSSDALPFNNHKVLPTSGNVAAYLTAYSQSVGSSANYTFNPSIQIRGMIKDDFWLAVIPVKNIAPTDKITVEASFGAAGSGASYYVLEFSDDYSNWYAAEGGTMMTLYGGSGLVHYSVPADNISTSRKTYDKATDLGYRKYTFPLSGIQTIGEGNLYLRLRISIDQRANATETTYAIASNAWADLKGLEISMQ